MLTTRDDHSCQIIEGSKGKRKQYLVFDHNNIKKGVDTSDQLGSYYNVSRKTLKWYRKIVFELICSTFVVNAFFIYKRWGSKKYDLLKFREFMIDGILEDVTVDENSTRKNSHFLGKFSKLARNKRKRCRML
jgi:hypothetical protein